MCKSAFYKNINTIIEASNNDVILAKTTIYNALDEVMKLYKLVHNAVVKHEMTNEQQWLDWETEMSHLTTADPTEIFEI